MTDTTTRITPEQEQALQALVALVPDKRNAPEPAPDLIKTWLGVSREDVNGFIAQLLSQKDVLEERLLDWAERRPLDSVFEFLAAASLAFYLAEKDVNPKAHSYIDAFYYISTCASVGYADVFAVTHTGRAIASLVMTLGPALTGNALARPKG